MRRTEALLHLSWNEWWEGSNLEPCREFGKTYAEKNLFYATLMRLVFPSLRQPNADAPVALLLNDWRLATGAPEQQELYGVVQTLRRLNVPFRLLPDEAVTTDVLRPFRLVVAPSFRAGLGYNAQRKRILNVLVNWLRSGDRRLILSHCSSGAALFGLAPAPTPPRGESKLGKDLNVFIDVGTLGDTEFLRSGYSHREDWGRLPRAAFGAGSHVTVRWTPGAGRDTTLVLPTSPNRDHVLRVWGRAIWPNDVTLLVNGRQAGSMQTSAGTVFVEARIPAKVIGSARMAELVLRYRRLNIPMERDAKRWPTESRVCNLAIDAIQWSTANTPAGRRETKYERINQSVELASPLFGEAEGRRFDFPYAVREALSAPNAQVLTRLADTHVARDQTFPFGPSQVLYVNGSLAEIESPLYWRPILEHWARVRWQALWQGGHVIATRLAHGDTTFVAAFSQNHTALQSGRLVVAAPAGLPLSEAVILASDGRTYVPLSASQQGDLWMADASMRYYGVYQFAFSPVRIETPPLALMQGTRRAFLVNVTNLTSHTVQGSLRVSAVIPSIRSDAVPVRLGPHERKDLRVLIACARTADWGRKTVFFALQFDGRRAVVLRSLTVQKDALAPMVVFGRVHFREKPSVQVVSRVVDARRPAVELAMEKNPYGQTAPLEHARARLERVEATVPKLDEGGRTRLSFTPLDFASREEPQLRPVTFLLTRPTPTPAARLEQTLFAAIPPKSYRGPTDAYAAVTVFNPLSTRLDHEMIEARVPRSPAPSCMRDEQGASLPCQFDADGVVHFLACVPPRGARTFFLCRGTARAPLGVWCDAQRLGSGAGRLVVRTPYYALALDEAAGGTVTHLQSLRTGRDYGRRSFGVDYGQFSRYDPARPKMSTIKFIHESKTRQEDAPGRIELVSAGPACAIARVSWSDARVHVVQTYEFPAYQPYFKIRQQPRPIDLGEAQELVAFNGRFNVQKLRKSYPNFVGKVNQKSQPHFGWRQGAWVPECLTLMTPYAFEESLSLVLTRRKGLTGVRQGFWPKRRPNSGPCEMAQIELLGDRRQGCDAEVYVLLHAGHQKTAEQFLASCVAGPQVIVESRPTWRARTQPVRSAKQDWFSPFYRKRVRLRVRTRLRPGQRVTVEGRAIANALADGAKAHVIAQVDDGAAICCPTASAPADGRVEWRVPLGLDTNGARWFMYFGQGGPAPALLHTAFRMLTRSIRHETFDSSTADWTFTGNVRLMSTAGRAGSKALRLQTNAEQKLALARYALIDPIPQAAYRVYFWAKAQTPNATVRVNFFADAKHDFPQVAVGLRNDGRWRLYTTQVRTGSFAEGVRPYFRLWLIGPPAILFIDDLSVTPLGAPPLERSSVLPSEVETYP